MQRVGVLITCLGDMAFVTEPLGLAFARTACVWIIGRDDPLGIGHRWAIAPPNLAVYLLIVLLPDLLQQLDLQQLSHGLRRLGLLANLEQAQPIAANVLAQFLT